MYIRACLWYYYIRTFVRCQGAVKNLSIFSERLANLRSTKNLPQDVVAKELDIGVRAYQYYEHGEREPKLSTLIRMADYFEVSLDYLTGRTDGPV